ncbi:MAG: hypothetical protein JWL60_2168 [Gemmatimonadetes bacterium]|jgi:hypothetical protein|nr:hypothetical protein [Gemmatimonadota bacterium]
MRRILMAACVAATFAVPGAGAQPANTDVYLSEIRRVGDSIVVGRPRNITRRAGYDNQPAFSADSRSVLYVAQSEGQTDVWRYDIATRGTVRLTRTPESEYSPTPIPGERRFSVIRVERDSTQRLWSFALTGRDPQLVLERLKPVGYHAWLGPRRLAAFVLGTPSTLHVIDRDGSGDAVVARNVGRALQALPGGTSPLFTFTQRDASDRLRIFAFTGRTQTVRHGRRTVRIQQETRAATPTEGVDSVVTVPEAPYELVAAAPDNEFHAWTPDNVLITATNSTIVRWNAVLGAASAWLPVADLRSYGVQNVTRLTMSDDGRWLAFVAEAAARP